MNKTGFSIKFVLFNDLPIKPENGQNGQHCHNPSYFRGVVWASKGRCRGVKHAFCSMYGTVDKCVKQIDAAYILEYCPQLYLTDLCLQDSKQQEGEHKLFSQNFS